MADLRTERVAVHNCRPALAPTTVGQRSIWTDIEYMMPDTSFYNSVVPVELAHGVSLDRVFSALRELCERHGALRSHFFRNPDGELVQRVTAGGEVTVEVCEARSDQDSDLYGLVGDLEASVRGHRFDHGTEWPIRVGVGVLDGAPLVVLLTVSHIAADFPSLRILAGELAALVQGRTLGPPPVQPVELSEWERSEEGLRVQERSLRYWRKHLRTMPPSLLPETGDGPEEPRYPTVWMRSRAVALAAGTLGARYRVSSSAVLLAATALLLGRATGTPHATMVLIAGNRTRTVLRDYVGNLAQDVPTGIDLSGDDFATVARRAWSASVNAYRNAYCERAATARLREEAEEERGTDLELAYFFNDLRPAGGDGTAPVTPSADDVRTALADTRTGTGTGVERDNLLFFLDVSASGTDEVELTLKADSLRLRSDGMKEFLIRIEALLVAAVEHGHDHGTEQLLELVGPTV
jgi:hypothetical protein